MPDYAAFGLTFRLPFLCPVLAPAPEGAVPDVAVVDGLVPRHLEAPVAIDDRWQAEPGRFLWRGGRPAGRFLVEGGRQVTLQRGPAADDESLAFHFVDSVVAAVLRQRGLLVLHASAAAGPAGAVAVSGMSGAGKSTTLAALLARGYSMLADDITALRLGPDGCVEALPGVRQMHLCPDAADSLGQDISGLPRCRWARLKAAVPTSLAPAAAPLRRLYRLSVGAGDGVALTSLSGVDRFAAVQECVYGPLLPQEHASAFALMAAVAGQVATYRLERPAGRWTSDAIAEAVTRG